MTFLFLSQVSLLKLSANTKKKVLNFVDFMESKFFSVI